MRRDVARRSRREVVSRILRESRAGASNGLQDRSAICGPEHSFATEQGRPARARGFVDNADASNADSVDDLDDVPNGIVRVVGCVPDAERRKRLKNRREAGDEPSARNMPALPKKSGDDHAKTGTSASAGRLAPSSIALRRSTRRPWSASRENGEHQEFRREEESENKTDENAGHQDLSGSSSEDLELEVMEETAESGESIDADEEEDEHEHDASGPNVEQRADEELSATPPVKIRRYPMRAGARSRVARNSGHAREDSPTGERSGRRSTASRERLALREKSSDSDDSPERAASRPSRSKKEDVRRARRTASRRTRDVNTSNSSPSDDAAPRRASAHSGTDQESVPIPIRRLKNARGLRGRDSATKSLYGTTQASSVGRAQRRIPSCDGVVVHSAASAARRNQSRKHSIGFESSSGFESDEEHTAPTLYDRRSTRSRSRRAGHQMPRRPKRGERDSEFESDLYFEEVGEDSEAFTLSSRKKKQSQRSRRKRAPARAKRGLPPPPPDTPPRATTAEERKARLDALVEQSALISKELQEAIDRNRDALKAAGAAANNQESAVDDDPEGKSRPLDEAELVPLAPGRALQPHQIDGVKWMLKLDDTGHNGILADEMGLGKTLQALAFLASIITIGRRGPHLVIAPLAVVQHWCAEAEAWFPTVMKVFAYYGHGAERFERLDSALKADDFDVIVTSYELALRDIFGIAGNSVSWGVAGMYRGVLRRFRQIEYEYVIVDEAHRLKNHKSKFTVALANFKHARRRLLLTGTPLSNHFTELWALLNVLNPRIFGSAEAFQRWFESPFEDDKALSNSEKALIVARMHTVLRPFFRRRVRADVCPDFASADEVLVRCPATPLQVSLQAFFRATRRGREVRCLNNVLMELRKTASCAWLVSDAIYSEKDAENVESVGTSSGKFMFIHYALPRLLAAGHRVLIFTQFRRTVTFLSILMDHLGIAHGVLDGSTGGDDRVDLIEEFNRKESSLAVFILTTRAGGVGINLQSADTVILFDSDWNPAADLQAISRIQRIGQTKSVHIMRLVTEGQIDEVIIERARKKLRTEALAVKAGKFGSALENDVAMRQKDIQDILDAFDAEAPPFVPNLDIDGRADTHVQYQVNGSHVVSNGPIIAPVTTVVPSHSVTLAPASLPGDAGASGAHVSVNDVNVGSATCGANTAILGSSNLATAHQSIDEYIIAWKSLLRRRDEADLPTLDHIPALRMPDVSSVPIWLRNLKNLEHTLIGLRAGSPWEAEEAVVRAEKDDMFQAGQRSRTRAVRKQRVDLSLLDLSDDSVFGISSSSDTDDTSSSAARRSKKAKGKARRKIVSSSDGSDVEFVLAEVSASGEDDSSEASDVSVVELERQGIADLTKSSKSGMSHGGKHKGRKSSVAGPKGPVLEPLTLCASIALDLPELLSDSTLGDYVRGIDFPPNDSRPGANSCAEAHPLQPIITGLENSGISHHICDSTLHPASRGLNTGLVPSACEQFLQTREATGSSFVGKQGCNEISQRIYPLSAGGSGNRLMVSLAPLILPGRVMTFPTPSQAVTSRTVPKAVTLATATISPQGTANPASFPPVRAAVDQLSPVLGAVRRIEPHPGESAFTSQADAANMTEGAPFSKAVFSATKFPLQRILPLPIDERMSPGSARTAFMPILPRLSVNLPCLNAPVKSLGYLANPSRTSNTARDVPSKLAPKPLVGRAVVLPIDQGKSADSRESLKKSERHDVSVSSPTQSTPGTSSPAVFVGDADMGLQDVTVLPFEPVAGKMPSPFCNSNRELATHDSGRVASHADNRRPDSKSSNMVTPGGVFPNTECRDVVRSTIRSPTLPNGIDRTVQKTEDGMTSSLQPTASVALPFQAASAAVLSTQSRMSCSASESTSQRSPTLGDSDAIVPHNFKAKVGLRDGNTDRVLSRELESRSKNLGVSISPIRRAQGRSYCLGTSTFGAAKRDMQFSQSNPLLTSARSTTNDVIVISSDSDDIAEPSTKRHRKK